MNASELYDKIGTGNRMDDQQQVLFELLAHIEILTVGVLELAGHIKRQGQKDDPLSYKTRLLLGEFIERKN
jgi:hypothetical protein